MSSALGFYVLTILATLFAGGYVGYRYALRYGIESADTTETR